MVEAVSSIITESVSVSLEGFVFMEAIPLSCKPEEMDDDNFLWANIEIQDPVKGVITLVFPTLLLNEIIESVYGPMISPDLDPFSDDADLGFPQEEQNGINDKMRYDTLAELVNTFAGQIMSRVVPEDVTFQLGLPVTGEGEAAADEKTGVFYFQLDEQIFYITVSGDLLAKLI